MIVGTAVVGVGVGAAAANVAAAASPRAEVYVEPTRRIMLERTPHGTRRVRVCD